MTEVVPWRQALDRSAAAFRLGHDGEGNELLGQFIDGFLRVLPGMEQSSIARSQAILEPMLQAQQRGDYLFLADLLEYELTPLFGDAE